MRVGIYARVSTQEQAQEGYSIDAQKERLGNYCKAKDWKVVANYIDAGYSGSNLNRPAMQSLIDDASNGKIDAVLVYKLDRISRSQKDTLFLIEDVFLKNGISFISLNENFDTSTAFGRAMIGILSVFAQLEREQIKERTRMGLEERIKQGKHHSFAPFGYRHINKELVINEDEAEVVRDIYSQTAQYKTLKQINDFVVKTYPEYTELFTNKNNKIYDIVHNITYGGYVKFGNSVSKGTHEPIVDEITYHRVQAILAEKAATWQKLRTKRTGTNSHYLLTGFLYCGYCGARVRAVPRHGGKYVCYSRVGTPAHMVKDRNCKCQIYYIEELDSLVLNELKKIKDDKSYFESLKRKQNDIDGTIDKNKRELKKTEAQMNKLLDLYQVDDIDIGMLSDRLKALTAKKKNLMEAIRNSEPTMIPKMEYDQVRNMLSGIDDLIKNEATTQLRELLQMLVYKIIVRDSGIEVVWNFS
ncbi:hypothetical protein SDC9_108704 [bioreactor metagenome]|uniref:Uncharacterized protein n=1 Tax=bioreactor metagenome TaxID=1076179 RepID=A0A645BB07_9ZZZZ|nr:recombinase family protein [Candidatus Metalachnospira sp.]